MRYGHVRLARYVLAGLLGIGTGYAAPADVLSEKQLAAVEADWTDGETAYNKKDWRLAMVSCHHGLDSLGLAYIDPEPVVLDDTGLKEVAGWAAERDGQLSIAANLYCGTLESRLSQYRDKQARQVERALSQGAK